MSERALEFVETWVDEAIEKMGKSPGTGKAQADALAAECVKDAQKEGIPESEIKDAFDDLAAFIAGQIDEARDRQTDRSGEAHPASLIENDDTRIIDEEEDEAEEDAKGG